MTVIYTSLSSRVFVQCGQLYDVIYVIIFIAIYRHFNFLQINTEDIALNISSL